MKKKMKKEVKQSKAKMISGSPAATKKPTKDPLFYEMNKKK